jgi:CRISPR-associated protein Cas1
MINEALYCERLMYLEWVQGEFSHNTFTVEGKLVHRRADEPAGRLPPRPDESIEDSPASDDDIPYAARSVWLSSEKLGITAKIDVVQGNESGEVIPIEYKRGKAPEYDWIRNPERAQLAAQAMLLREHGYICNEAALYFAGSRRRVSIALEPSLLAMVVSTVRRIKELTAKGQIPPPTKDEQKCQGCSLVGICLPDETRLLHDRPEEGEPASLAQQLSLYPELTGPLEPDPWQLAGTGEAALTRRLHPARDDKMPLYIQEQGAQIRVEGELIIVRRQAGAAIEVRLPMLSQVMVLGNVQITTQAIRALMERDIPLTYFTYGGWMYSRVRGLSSKNVELRVAQVRAAMDPQFCLKVARGLVVGKVKNSRTMLRRNAIGVTAQALSELDQLAYKAERAEALESLLGLEGTAARTYFGEFTRMLKSKVEPAFELDGRNRRPPRDPVNAMLSFAYSLLTKEFAVTLETVGLDPMLGFYHQTRFGRPSLALDLMEEFRPIVADSVVVGVVNNGVLKPDDFVVAPTGVAIASAGRKKFIEAYERRMDQLVTHPVFGYRISYRRVIEVQARLLGRLLLGEIEAYPSFRTR